VLQTGFNIGKQMIVGNLHIKRRWSLDRLGALYFSKKGPLHWRGHPQMKLFTWPGKAWLQTNITYGPYGLYGTSVLDYTAYSLTMTLWPYHPILTQEKPKPLSHDKLEDKWEHNTTWIELKPTNLASSMRNVFGFLECTCRHTSIIGPAAESKRNGW